MAKAFDLNSKLQAKVERLKKGGKKKNKKKLEKEIVELRQDLEDLDVEKMKSDQATKRSY